MKFGNELEVNALGERLSPFYGMAVLWILLAIAAFWISHCYVRSEQVLSTIPKGDLASIFGFLPESVLTSATFLEVSRLTFYLASLCWAFRIGVPWSSWLSALSFIFTASLHLENFPNCADHTKHYVAMLILIYALWTHSYAKEIRSKNFWTEPVYPRWVHFLSLFYMASAYTAAGLSKLFESGLSWPNGISLQIWVYLWGDQSSVLTNLLLSQRWLATSLQTVVLLLEVGALFSLLNYRLRVIWALLLIVFHFGNEAVFHFHFELNTVIIAVLFLPPVNRSWTKQLK